MTQKLDCKDIVKQYTHAVSVKFSILQKIEGSFGLTPTKLTSLNDWTSSVLLLLRSDCDEANVYRDQEARQRYEHNKDLVLDWITKISTILAQHDRLIQGNAPPSEEDKKEVKKDVEGEIDKMTTKKPEQKATAQATHSTTHGGISGRLAANLSRNVTETELPNYSNLSLADLLSLSDVLDHAIKSGIEQKATSVG